MTTNHPHRGVALLTRGADGMNLLLGCTGSGDPEEMVAACLRAAVAKGGSAHPEDWMAWTLNQAPSPALLADLEQRVASGQGAVSHPAVTNAIFDARHPGLAARGDA